MKLHRKLASGLVRVGQLARIKIFRIKVKLLSLDVIIGQNVNIGKMVTLRTRDGGQIILRDGVTLDDFVNLDAKGGLISVGSGTYIGVGCQMVALSSISVGRSCLVAAYSVVRDANHGIAPGIFISHQKHTAAEIVIEDDVWLGSHVVVTAGSSIGRGAVIGANAVVTKNIPSNYVAVGVPAKIMRCRGFSENDLQNTADY